MAEDVVDAVCKALGVKHECVTDKKPLAGSLPLSYEDYIRDVVPELSAEYKIPPETVRHLVSYYGSRAERIMQLVEADPESGETISLESRDLYAQVSYSVLEEDARTLSDIVLRRLHLGMTASRGLQQAERIAEIAGAELKWSDDEKHHQIEAFKETLRKERACLKV
jgi:glycerol-3-phosphate dehydrogenase